MKLYFRSLTAYVFLLVVSTTPVSAAVTFYTDQAAFNAASTTSLIDFEGLVAGDTDWSRQTELIISGVRFTAETPEPDMTLICGRLICDGNPFDSALLTAIGDFSLVADFDLIGSPVTAVGGVFSDLTGPTGLGHFFIYGEGGVELLHDTVTSGSMGSGLLSTFFGWTTTGGDVITRIEFSVEEALNASVDDFQFGTEGTYVVPLPAALPLFASALFGLGLVMRKRKSVA